MSIRDMTRAFAAPDDRLAFAHLGISLVMYVGAIGMGGAHWGNWFVVVPAIFLFAGASVRIFGIQHDNGHFSYFSRHRWNIVSGVLLGAITMNPFWAMRYNHNRHHANIGNLDEMRSHEVWTMTVAEYRAAPWHHRTAYRVYRSLPVIFFFGPIFIIFLRYRLPKNFRKTGWVDVLVQNTLMLALWGGVYGLGGWPYFAFMVTAAVTTACMGVVMVYVGHNHEETYWARDDAVDFEEASLKGSSVIDLGPVFDFMTFNFPYHDLHHLNSQVPCYRLRACHKALSPHIQPTRLGLWQALACIQWKLWDEDRGRMVRFRDLERVAVLQPAE